MDTMCLRRTKHSPCGVSAKKVKTQSNHEDIDKQKRKEGPYCSKQRLWKSFRLREAKDTWQINVIPDTGLAPVGMGWGGVGVL